MGIYTKNILYTNDLKFYTYNNNSILPKFVNFY